MSSIAKGACILPLTYYTVTLGPLMREGHAVAEFIEQDAAGEQHTRVLPVPAGLPGEEVTIAVETPPTHPGRRRRRHRKARPPRVWISEIHRPSPLRIQALCPVFGTCGGCQLQHMQYQAQLSWKHNMVETLLREIGGFSEPPMRDTVACDDPWHYRNHMRFSVNRGGQMGLTVRGTRQVLPLTSCPIAEEQINKALTILSQRTNAQPQLLLRYSAVTKQMLIQPYPPSEALQVLTAAGLDIRQETMEEELGGELFRICPNSFFQTNTAQAEKMVQMVLNGLLQPSDQIRSEPGGLTIADAYCGVGTFALTLAQHIGKVIAIEESASAIKDAEWNLRTTTNVEILKGKVEHLLPNLASQLDGLVIDPPRAGCQQIVLDALIEHPISKIVYVSCDPATLARDLHILCHRYPVYRLCSVQPLDMFPQTAHIECIAVLEGP